MHTLYYLKGVKFYLEEIKQIFDRIFKRLFSLSNRATLNLINGLFGTDYPPDRTVVYTNRESTDVNLKHHYADVFILIDRQFHYHLEAQMTFDDNIVLRVFEYGFHHAMETQQDGSLQLVFPEPVVIYLADRSDIPPESILHIDFQGQASVDYHVRNFVYLRHSLGELEQKKLIVLIPFQVLRLRSLLYDSHGNPKIPDENPFNQLLKIIESDIIKAINTNLSAGNITATDAGKLVELTEALYQQIILHYQERGGEQVMRPLLPGAMRLPNDQFYFYVEDLEEKYDAAQELNKIMTERASLWEEEAAIQTERADALATRTAALYDENAALSDEIEKLKARIQKLESVASE